jgi:FkbM family methyltransferase
VPTDPRAPALTAGVVASQSSCRRLFHPVSIAHNILVQSAPLRRWSQTMRIWDHLWSALNDRFDGPVTSRIYGRWAVANVGYISPAFARQYPSYNRALVDLTRAVADARSRPIGVVDVGAAVGDTLMLLFSRCSGLVSSAIAIDGDDEFFSYLTANFRGDERVEPVRALLAASASRQPNLVRTHSGTSSAIGPIAVEATTLDAVLHHRYGRFPVDLLKIDTDGFDGEVLAGARAVLACYEPAVLFEWSPTHCSRAKTDPVRAFLTLRDLGYRRFVWFRSTGDPVPDDDVPSLTELPQLAKRLTEQSGDEHFDVVALPPWMSDDALDHGRPPCA